MKTLVKYVDNLKYYLHHYAQGVDFPIEDITISVDSEQELMVDVTYNINGGCVIAQANVEWSMLSSLSDDEGIGLVISLLYENLITKMIDQKGLTLH